MAAEPPADDVVGGDGGMASERMRCGVDFSHRVGWGGTSWCAVCEGGRGSDGSRAEPRRWVVGGGDDGVAGVGAGWGAGWRPGLVMGVYHYAFEVFLHNDCLYALLDVSLIFTIVM